MAGVALVLRSDVFARVTDATVVGASAFGEEFVLARTQVVRSGHSRSDGISAEHGSYRASPYVGSVPPPEGSPSNY
jgi:hypothetical protein